MMMNWHLRSHLKGIEKTMAFIIKTAMKVIVLAQTRRLLGLLYHIIDKLIVYYFHKYSHFLFR
jgi:hypothetical protein